MGWLTDSVRSISLGPFDIKDAALARHFARPQTTARILVNEATALNFSAVWAAVQLISSSVGALPLLFYKRTAAGKEKFTSHPLYSLLHDEPNPQMTAIVFRETLQAHALLWGNGYAEIQRDEAARPFALWPLEPNRVIPYRERSGELRYTVYGYNTATRELGSDDILHIPGLGWDGICGYSVVAKARESFALGLAAERFGATFFGNGAVATGVLEHPGRLSEDAQKRLKAQLDGYSGEGAHGTMVLEEGMAWKQMTIPQDDAQFLGSRAFQVNEVARWFNIPPHKIRDLSRATFSNIFEQNIEYVQETLMPWLVRWEQELNRKLIRPLEQKTQFFKHNVGGFLRGNPEQRATFYNVMRNVGAYSANDIRELEDLNGIGPQGDVYWMPGNMVDAKTPIQWEPAPKPAPPAVAEPPADTGPQEGRAVLLAAIEALGREIVALRERPGAEVLTPKLDGLIESFSLLAARWAGGETSFAEIAQSISAFRTECDELAKQAMEAQGKAEAWADQAIAEATRAAEALAAHQPPPPPVPPAPSAAGAPDDAAHQQRSRLIAAQRAIADAIIGRIARREASQARQHGKTPEALARWLPGFYAKHQPECERELGPVLQLHGALVSDASDATERTKEFTAKWIDRSRADLHGLIDRKPEPWAEALETVLTGWERDRADQLADSLMQEEIAHHG